MALALQFEEASKRAFVKIYIDTKAQRLVDAAWDGGQGTAPLPVALEASSNFLQEFCDAYLRVVPTELVAKHPGFLEGQFRADVTSAFRNLPDLSVGKFRRVDFGNVVGVLDRTRDRWETGVSKHNVSIVLSFC
jgi:hypothetical protein